MPPVVAGAAEIECSVRDASSGVENDSVGFDILARTKNNNRFWLTLSIRSSCLRD